MSDILYNFAQNHASLDDINGHLNAIQSVREDINSIFNTLSTVYEGEGRDQLLRAQQEVSNMLDEAVNNSLNVQKQAGDQQDAMRAMDLANAADF
jgi:polyphosphate kinase